MSKTAIIEGDLVLHENIQIVSVSDFHPNLLSRLGGDENDYVVSIRHSRMQSKRISKDAAEFLEYFHTPCSIVKAVMVHSQLNNLEPQELLKAVYEFVISCVHSGILDNPIHEQIGKKDAKFTKGTWFNGFRICSCVQFLADTQVYQAEDNEGKKVALKYVVSNASPQVIEALCCEINTLNQLKALRCEYVPKIFDASADSNNLFIITSWCEGKTLFNLLQETSLTVENKYELIVNLVTAYSSLSKAGILHGDVHPNNIIVSDSLHVQLVDFGSAVPIEQNENKRKAGRVGSVSYFSPEMAIAELEQNDSFLINPLSEQYHIAVLIYLIVTGNMYLPLSLEKNIALEQIINVPPISFAEFSINWPTLEKVLLSGLQKKPVKRFGTLHIFFEAVLRAVDEAIKTNTKIHLSNASPVASHNQNGIFNENVKEFIDGYGLHSKQIANGLTIGPTASLFHGSAGIAYAFLRLACLFESPALLTTAEIWIMKAKHEQFKPDAFINNEIGLLLTDIGPCSLFHNLPGIHMVDAYIQHASCNIEGYKQAVNDFICLTDSWYMEQALYGSAFMDTSQGAGGILIGASQLFTLSTVNADSQGDILKSIIRKYSLKLIEKIKSDLLSADVSKKRYMGFAHGYAGSLYAIIASMHSAGLPIPNTTEMLLEILQSQGIRSKNGLYWPIYFGTTEPVWTGWCHGSAGYILLWLRAARAYENDKYLENAILIGEHIWHNYGKSGPSVCCGTAGESLSLLLLGKATGEKKWQNRGLYLARMAVKSNTHFDQPNSLFKGSVGLYLLSAEAMLPSTASWLVFESPL